MDTFQTPKGKCPTCGEILDAATDYKTLDGESRPPQPGDIAVCWGCSEILEFVSSEGELKVAELNTLLQLHPKQHAVLTKTQAWIRKQRPTKEQMKGHKP